MLRLLACNLLLLAFTARAQNVISAPPPASNSAQAPALQPASLAALSAAAAATPRNEAHVSTLVQPKLIHTVEITANGQPHYFVCAQKRVLTLTLDVAADGKPTNIAILDPQNIDLDEQIVATVSQYRFRPATLDGKATSMAVRIKFVLTPGTVY